MNVTGIPEVKGYKNISLRYRGMKMFKWIEKEGHGFPRNIISNLLG